MHHFKYETNMKKKNIHQPRAHFNITSNSSFVFTLWK